jgi:mannosyltransferase
MPRRATYRHYSRPFRQHARLFVAAVVLMVLEVLWHTRQFVIPRPAQSLDEPFYRGCQEPILNTSARADAAVLMLARNADLQGAVDAIRSFEKQFNRHFQYPVVFLNDEPWSEAFKTSLRAEISGEVVFDVIDRRMWGYPPWIDRDKARKNMKKQEHQGLSYGGKESYHHMCRFNSGYVVRRRQAISS